MKIASFKKVITCQIGDDLGGYGNGIISASIHDDLFLLKKCKNGSENAKKIAKLDPK